MADLIPLIFGSLCGGFFILVLAGVGVYMIVVSLRSRKKAESSQAWPHTLGQVVRAEVKRTSNTDDDGHISYTYHPEVEYTYEVAGQTYSSQRLMFGAIRAYNTTAKAQRTLARYPVGSQVTVYYDPAKPADSVLERIAGASTSMLVIGIAMILVSACVTCVFGASLANVILKNANF